MRAALNKKANRKSSLPLSCLHLSTFCPPSASLAALPSAHALFKSVLNRRAIQSSHHASPLAFNSRFCRWLTLSEWSPVLPPSLFTVQLFLSGFVSSPTVGPSRVVCLLPFALRRQVKSQVDGQSEEKRKGGRRERRPNSGWKKGKSVHPRIHIFIQAKQLIQAFEMSKKKKNADWMHHFPAYQNLIFETRNIGHVFIVL